jgi:SAM-dependent methyltransferase
LEKEQSFTPALGVSWATKKYDAVMSVTMREAELRKRTLALVRQKERKRILELGCGTGSLTWALADLDPTTEVTGVDIDPATLQIAAEKFSQLRSKARPNLVRSDITASDQMEALNLGRFDTVITSLVLHHLSHEGKLQALQVAKNHLAPEGQLIVVDWGPGATIFHSGSFVLVRLLDGFDVTRANIRGEIPSMVSQAGFSLVTSETLINTVFGSVWAHTAKIS